MARQLPPLNPLHVFETAARLGNLTRASEELHVTQSAVSRQVSTLEGYLGVQLFERIRGGVALTAEGRAYYTEIGPAFALISGATEKLVLSTPPNRVRVRTYTTFVAKWLMRRLPLFQSLHPAVDVKLSTATRPVDFARDEVDMAIQVGTPPFAAATSQRLFDDEIEPVCSPALIHGEPPLVTINDLGRHRLLHAHYRREDWNDWLRHMGRSELGGADNHMTFSSSVLTYQAAIEGMGVAMGQVHLLEQEFRSRQLVRPLRSPLRRHAGYHVLVPASRRLSPSAAVFRDWLVLQAALETDAFAGDPCEAGARPSVTP